MTPANIAGAVRVIVVEDDNFTRHSVVAALDASGVQVVGSTAIAGEGHALAKRTRPHAAVLDLHLGEGPTGVDLALALRREDPGIGIVLLTSYDDPRMLSASIPDTPAGTQYVTKKSVETIQVLVKAIRASISSHVVKPTRTSNSELEILTNTQLEVLRLIAEGNSNQQIAALRGISAKSLEGTVSRLLKALNIPAGNDVNQRVLLARAYFEAAGLKSND